jgi:hypothetical protein
VSGNHQKHADRGKNELQNKQLLHKDIAKTLSDRKSKKHLELCLQFFRTNLQLHDQVSALIKLKDLI